MDLHTIKFGLGIAAVVISGMIILFALYVQMGTSRQKEKVVLHHKEKQN